jgi:hypothetical protein
MSASWKGAGAQSQEVSPDVHKATKERGEERADRWDMQRTSVDALRCRRDTGGQRGDNEGLSSRCCDDEREEASSCRRPVGEFSYLRNTSPRLAGGR